MFGLYRVFNYTEAQKAEVEYLVTQVLKLGILKRTDESLFQFSPRLVEERTEKFNEHEPWAWFHKKILAHEIIFFLIEEIVEGDYTQENLINEHIWNETFAEFINKTDMTDMTKQEIIDSFKIYIEPFVKELKEKHETV